MERFEQQLLTGERALYGARDVSLSYCTFADGESPVKECRNVALDHCLFRWKYPIWYSGHVTLNACTLFETARAGIWYSKDITVREGSIEAPKTFRRSEGILLDRVSMPNAQETLWMCRDVELRQVTTRGDYILMNSENLRIDGWKHNGNYAIDGAKHVEIRNSELVTKDAFWNCEDVYVRDSAIYGEYLGWNSKNVTLENCLIDSLQGMCYMDNVRLINCRLINTTLAFEYSVVDATVQGRIDSVYNPRGGKIVAESIDRLIQDPRYTDPAGTEIRATVADRAERPDWEKEENAGV